jgi:hypothetical protein
MGRHLELYTKNATCKDLSSYLEGLGFKKCVTPSHLPKSSLSYYWFDHEDFKSFDGVSATIYRLSRDECQTARNNWVLSLYNRVFASWHDVAMLNSVLKEAKTRFGGVIKGDYGTNRYATLWEDKSTPISRGISLIYQQVTREMSQIRVALPEPYHKYPESNNGKINELQEFNARLDPSRVIYNGLVPFAVSMFEYFFSRAFRILIKYDEYALEKRGEEKFQIDFSATVKVVNKERKVVNREKTVEEIIEMIAEKYTFQNLEKLNNAYKTWLEIDVKKLLGQQKKLDKSVNLLSEVDEIISYRHGIIHHFAIDKSLNKEEYIRKLDVILMSIDEFVLFIEEKYKIEIQRFP